MNIIGIVVRADRKNRLRFRKVRSGEIMLGRPRPARRAIFGVRSEQGPSFFGANSQKGHSEERVNFVLCMSALAAVFRGKACKVGSRERAAHEVALYEMAAAVS